MVLPKRSYYLLLLSLALLCGLGQGALPRLPGANLVNRLVKGKQADPRDHATDIAGSEDDFHQATAPVLAEDIADAISEPKRRRYVFVCEFIYVCINVSTYFRQTDDFPNLTHSHTYTYTHTHTHRKRDMLKARFGKIRAGLDEPDD